MIMDPCRSRHGFSLIEVLMALMVTAVAMAIAVPSISVLRQETSLHSVQREIMSALYMGRSSAIANNGARSVVITPPALIQIRSRDGTITYYERDLSAYGSGIAVGGNSLSPSTPITITYDARGLLTPATAVTLTISNGLRQSKTVTIYPTGKPAAG